MLDLSPRVRSLLAVVPVVGLTSGGWAVTTLDDLPDYMVAGRATPIGFMVRQHGVENMEGLTPTVEARSGSERIVVRATATGARGHYVAPLSLPRAGRWSLTVASGFGRERVEIDAMTAIAPGAAAPSPLPDAERGRRLFAAKGCVTCHVSIQVGPSLAGRRYDPTWLASYLDHPQQVRPAAPGAAQMPRLGLSPREIAGLVAYVNTGTVAAKSRD